MPRSSSDGRVLCRNACPPFSLVEATDGEENTAPLDQQPAPCVMLASTLGLVHLLVLPALLGNSSLRVKLETKKLLALFVQLANSCLQEVLYVPYATQANTLEIVQQPVLHVLRGGTVTKVQNSVPTALQVNIVTLRGLAQIAYAFHVKQANLALRGLQTAKIALQENLLRKEHQSVQPVP